jgi:hypothetical protein
MTQPNAPTLRYALSDYDGLEVAPCRNTLPEDCPEGTCYERCTREEAEIWSVYGRIPEGGVECLDDFRTEECATAWADYLATHNPCLQKHGVQVYG